MIGKGFDISYRDRIDIIWSVRVDQEISWSIQWPSVVADRSLYDLFSGVSSGTGLATILLGDFLNVCLGAWTAFLWRLFQPKSGVSWSPLPMWRSGSSWGRWKRWSRGFGLCPSDSTWWKTQLWGMMVHPVARRKRSISSKKWMSDCCDVVNALSLAYSEIQWLGTFTSYCPGAGPSLQGRLNLLVVDFENIF